MLVAAEYQPVRIPRGHGELLVVPPWEQAAAQLAENMARASQQDAYDVQGLALAELRRRARRELLAEARAYTAHYRDLPEVASGRCPILIAGHQPQLFHPGVWVKNFALSALAAAHQGSAVNLLIDNDIQRMPSIRVPAGTPSDRRMTTAMFDRAAEAIPYEERSILDADVFASFGSRVEQALEGLVVEPLIRKFWPLAIDAASRSRNLGRCLAEARHRLEGQWSQQTLEIPLSRVCRSACFATFAVHLLAHLPRFHEVYNSSLAEYRQVNRVRSRSHPVPDLAVDGPWLETPFWVWTSSAPHRQRLFARRVGQRLELTDRGQIRVTLELSPDSGAERAAEQWVATQRAAVKLRPRALITTMYSRLVLGDLFLHGVGGAKYDQLTDLITQRFFALRPPGYMMLSATALLFEDRTASLREQLGEARWLERDLVFHPEHHAVPSAESASLAAEKAKWLAQDPPREQRSQRHQAIQRINAALREHVPISPRQANAHAQTLAAAVRHESQFSSREFAFCLFPERPLYALLQDLTRPAAHA